MNKKSLRSLSQHQGYNQLPLTQITWMDWKSSNYFTRTDTEVMFPFAINMLFTSLHFIHRFLQSVRVTPFCYEFGVIFGYKVPVTVANVYPAVLPAFGFVTAVRRGSLARCRENTKRDNCREQNCDFQLVLHLKTSRKWYWCRSILEFTTSHQIKFEMLQRVRS